MGILWFYWLLQALSTMAEPLTRLTKKGTKYVWSTEADKASHALKAALLQVPTLAFPCPDRPCILDTNCSNVAYGSVLTSLLMGKRDPLLSFRGS